LLKLSPFVFIEVEDLFIGWDIFYDISEIS